MLGSYRSIGNHFSMGRSTIGAVLKQTGKNASKESLLLNEYSYVRLNSNDQKGFKVFQFISVISIVGFVVLMAIYMIKPVTIDFPEDQETIISIDQQMEEQRVFGDTLEDKMTNEDNVNTCNDSCNFELVESIPCDMAYETNSTTMKPLYQAWMGLLNMTQERIHVASYYWSLKGEDINVNDSSSEQGEDILKKFESLLMENVSVYIATSLPTLAVNSTDLKVLKEKGAHVRRINFGHLTKGVLHSKFWIVDMKHMYIGSANMDWRSFSQVKEVGAVIYNCSCLAKDLWKTFRTYWDLGHANATVPSSWPSNYSTKINKYRPLEVQFNGTLTTAYFSASPPAFCPKGRTPDLISIIDVINDAEEYVYVSVMEYFPTTRFSHPAKYWPDIDNALRRVAFNHNVQIRLLISCWLHTDPSMFHYLQSLRALSDPHTNITIDVKIFIVPVLNHTNIPFGRVNHNKYMVTDKVAYVGTSNWSKDYFSTTAGVGLIINQMSTDPQRKKPVIQEQLKNLFERDWNSKYSVNMEDLHGQKDCVWEEELSYL
ncbi:5'-3' exonuclease PLD4 isoform X1 [Pelodiscus sinensis]|uniref:5'-3' exonuclease PLD4 isoform X1 n=2 Tax=Pelodiscus sinensis TaxID=13735 RepID=UPI003F6CF831